MKLCLKTVIQSKLSALWEAADMAIPTREEMYRALEERHGAEYQKKLSAASVAVCGLGGLGSNIAIALARHRDL